MDKRKSKTFRYGRASAKLQHLESDSWLLTNLWSYNKGRGEAKGVMQRICDFADQEDATIFLTAQAYGQNGSHALDNDSLVKFYRKFGFKATNKRSPIGMFRPPSQEKRRL